MKRSPGSMKHIPTPKSVINLVRESFPTEPGNYWEAYSRIAEAARVAVTNGITPSGDLDRIGTAAYLQKEDMKAMTDLMAALGIKTTQGEALVSCIEMAVEAKKRGLV